MLITRQADYAIRVVIFLAHKGQKRLVPAKEIAETAAIPRSFLPGIISILAKRKIVVTEKGKGGGVRLAKKPDEITVLDIVEAVDGTPQMNVCMERPDACPFVEFCKMHEIWKEIQNYIHSKLKGTKISDVLVDYNVSGK